MAAQQAPTFEKGKLYNLPKGRGQESERHEGQDIKV